MTIMMAYFMHYLKSNKNLYAVLIIFILTGNLNAFEGEKNIEIKNFNFEKNENSYSIGFVQKIKLTNTIKSAINKGIPFDFKIVCKVFIKNNFWFDKKIQQVELFYRIKYKALKQVFEVHDIYGKKKEFNSLDEAIKSLNIVKDWDLNFKNKYNTYKYYVVLKIKLDKKKLPKPLQVNFFDKSWNIESRKYEYLLELVT
jgi:hypothetical protein